MNFPPEGTEPLINALRDELQEYGALLRLLENQQSSLLGRRSTEVLAFSQDIETHLPTVSRARYQRQSEVRRIAGDGVGGEGEDPMSLKALLPHFPKTVAPMIRGLVEEINKLVARVSRFARQNQMLLARAVEGCQTTLQTMRPAAVHKTYSPNGRINVGTTDAWHDTRCVA